MRKLASSRAMANFLAFLVRTRESRSAWPGGLFQGTGALFTCVGVLGDEGDGEVRRRRQWKRREMVEQEIVTEEEMVKEEEDGGRGEGDGGTGGQGKGIRIIYM